MANYYWLPLVLYYCYVTYYNELGYIDYTASPYARVSTKIFLG